tara:strand:+ start:15289 stop:15549 length:261 start_codon:yes stop_codon:yes gene_type:complete
MSISKEDAQAYWKENLKIIFSYLVVWFAVSFGCGILFIEELNSIDFFGFQLGFWFAQQGSIFVFCILIVAYAASMNKLDQKYDVHE